MELQSVGLMNLKLVMLFLQDQEARCSERFFCENRCFLKRDASRFWRENIPQSKLVVSVLEVFQRGLLE